MSMIQMDSVKHDKDEPEPVFFLAEDVVSVRGAAASGPVRLVWSRRSTRTFPSWLFLAASAK